MSSINWIGPVSLKREHYCITTTHSGPGLSSDENVVCQEAEQERNVRL